MDKVRRSIQIIFIAVFIMMLVLPLCFTNLKNKVRSPSENRELTSKAVLYLEDGTINTEFLSDFEAWFDDNVGFRTEIVLANARMQYHLFDVLANSSNMYLGPEGELNYATGAMIADYAHVNLLSEQKLYDIAASYQIVKDYVEDQGNDFYYVQCWDKHSIYPEYFMKGVIQYGDTSKTDQIIDAMASQTDISIISFKDMLISEKENYNTYSIWGDASHWSQRGAYMSYVQMMGTINENSGADYRVLDESDYDITVEDAGSTMFGGIHEEDYEESFVISAPNAYQTDEEPLYLSQWQLKSRKIYVNDDAGNNDTILIMGDSYIDNFMVDDIAESFARTVLIWSGYTEHLPEIVEYYGPRIVIYENAERNETYNAIIDLAAEINGGTN